MAMSPDDLERIAQAIIDEQAYRRRGEVRPVLVPRAPRIVKRPPPTRPPQTYPPLYWLWLLVAFFGAFAGVAYWRSVVDMINTYPVQALALFVAMGAGAAGRVAMYLHEIPEDSELNYRTIGRRAAAGSVFGVLGSKLAAGLELNDALQTVAAGAAGAKGPKAMDMAIQKVAGDRDKQ